MSWKTSIKLNCKSFDMPSRASVLGRKRLHEADGQINNKEDVT